jgi:3-oxoacyl-[acyl-carrier protein] reductase
VTQQLRPQRLSPNRADTLRGQATTDNGADRRAIVIVGASGEVGRAVADALCADDHALTLTGRHAAVVSHLGADAPGPVAERWQHADVTDPDSVNRLIDDTIRVQGPPYALVYCAGVVRDMPLSLTTNEAWSAVIETNLTGAFNCLRAVSRPMMLAGRGRVVLIGSVAGRCGAPGQSSYSASKAGLEGLCRVAAVELARYRITCNVVAPGPLESAMFKDVGHEIVSRTVGVTPLRRLGTTADVGGVVRFLLGDGAAFITGQTIVVDGGISAQ